jgi:sugar phosphate isomerase/epimerase
MGVTVGMSDTNAGGRLPVALAPLSVGRPEPSGLIKAATAGEFSGVGMTLRTPEGNWQEWCHDSGAVANVKAELLGNQLSPLDVGIVTLDPATDLDAVRKLAGLAAGLGASRLVLMCRDPDFDRSVRQLRLIGDIAAGSGLRVGVEFMPYTAARDLPYAVRLVEAAGHPNAGVLFDMFQHIRSGGETSDLTPAVTSKFVLVQLCDGVLASPPPDMLRQEALTDRRYPGEGEFPLAEIMSRIPRDIPVTVETPCQRYASLPLAEQGAALGRATRLTLARLGR